ncbi:MAG: hypothetical protein LBK47_01440 [Prevotellaceae bacterium]|jgi:DNA-binding CsgD family transcriptional regulator|nr:hypothetical protein [Prevotellaceae bacterium]
MRNIRKIQLTVKVIFTVTLVVILAAKVHGFTGNPSVTNYTDVVHQASVQNWAATQDGQGIMYFANSSGMLEFDGARWLLHELPGQRGTRTVAYHTESNRIFCGAFEEFGYWQRNSYGELLYYSLSDSLSGYSLHNDEIWSIAFFNNTVYFRSFTSFFAYHNGTINAGTFPSVCLALNEIHGKLYAATTDNGICVFNNEAPETLPGGGQYRASALLPFGSNSLLIATQNKGLYLYNGHTYSRFATEADELFRHAEINRGLILSDSIYIFGTLLDGVVAINQKGKLLWHLHKLNGLQNNTVLGLCSDHEHNIWLALDNGIDHVEINSALRFYLGTYDNIEAVYAITKHNNRLYLGTNKGLFCSQANGDGPFTIIPGTHGQVWDLSVWDGQLLCGHNTGTFRIEGSKATLISNVNGGYCLRAINANTLIQSTYTKLVIYKNQHGTWQYSHTIPDFIEPLNHLEVDHLGNIWVAHLEKGFFKIRLNREQTHIEKITRYSHIGGKSAEHIGIAKINSRIVMTTGQQLFTYNDMQDSVILYDKLNNALGKFNDAHKIIPGLHNRYWFARQNELALILIDEPAKAEVLRQIPHRTLKNQIVTKNESVYTSPQGRAFIGLTSGFSTLSNQNKPMSVKPAQIVLRQVRIEAGNGHLSLLPINSQQVQLSAKQNNLKFFFAYPTYSADNAKLYYRLEGIDNEWVVSNENFEKEYSRLPSRKYTFEVKAVGMNGQTLAQAQYHFVIKPAWYVTTTAYFIYVLLVALALALAYRLWNVQLEKHQKKIREQEEKKRLDELEQKEQKITKLKNEKLESEVLYKSKELASTTMAIIQKKNVLLELKKELQKEDSAKNIKSILRIINKNLSYEDDWKVFQSNFDLIHDRFFRNLKKRTPTLTAHDLQLCAYLRLNLSTKEIAQLMGNSVRGVEVARYRLRKKLQLPQEVNLNEFMIEFRY